MKPYVRASAALSALALLSACTGTGGEAGTDHDLHDGASVVVSSYPLEFLANRIGGDAASMTNVVPAGAEPHDLELSPRDVFTMESADLTITVAGFQPAVDAATAGLESALDLSATLDLQTRDGVLDPHFWLDPARMILAAEPITQALEETDPAEAEGYRERAESVITDLTALDSEFRDGLSQCEYDSFVTGHAAFGYLADAYGLREIAIAGIDPDTEPSTAALAATRDEIRALGLPMVFAEPGETKIADVLAAELGISSGVLNPIEAVGAGEDYLSLMRENLASLKEGLQCR